MNELDILTASFIGTPDSYKAKVWFAVEKDDSYKVGLKVRYGNRQVYTALTKDEALLLAETLNEYASKVDEINDED